MDEPRTVLLVLLTIACVVLRSYLDSQRAEKAWISNDEFLSSLARVRQCSVYDLFVHSGREWKFSRSKAEIDFEAYIRSGHIPPYVVRYVKQHIAAEEVKALRRLG